MLNQFHGWEWLVLVVLVVLLFGAKRLPEAARSVGRSLRILKAETTGQGDGSTSNPEPTTEAPTTVPTGP